MAAYSYIPNEFGKAWVASRHEARRGVHTPLAYIDINEGNRFDADVFAQIMYWHEPNQETGESRMKHQRDGYYWLTKNHSDWFAETRIKKETVRKCLDRLHTRKLIVYELHGDAGNVTPWIRVNWEEFERRMKLWIENNHSQLNEKQYNEALSLYHIPDPMVQDTIPPVISDHTPCDTIPDPMVGNPISNTETTQRVSELENGKTDSPTGNKPTAFVDFVESELFDESPPEEQPTVLTEQQAYDLAVCYFFGIKHPTQNNNKGWSHIRKMGNFFRGKIGQDKPNDAFKEFQFKDEPFTPLEIIGMRLWWTDQFDDISMLQKPATIAEKETIFRPTYDEKLEARAQRRLEKEKEKVFGIKAEPAKKLIPVDVEKTSALIADLAAMFD